MTSPILAVIKTSAATIGAGLTALWAQSATFLDGILNNAAANVGLIGILAVLVGRYTFRQLEDYRSDLGSARARIDELVTRIERLQDDLHKLGQSKADAEARQRELEAYAHRIRLWAISAGVADSEIPPPPTITV